MKILVDAFGGDNAPVEIIKGAILSLEKDKDFSIILVGKKEVIEEELSKYEYDKARVEILEANDVITCDEEPTMAVRRKPDSTIVAGFKKLKEDDSVDAFISAGSTGAYLVGATLKLGRLKGVSRPALCPILPTVNEGQQVLLLDSGANADCKVENLCQFAVMGSSYASVALGVESPRVALLSNGTEDKKGNALTHEVFPKLKENKEINFIGNIEARDILFGVADVVVCDGFAGNVAIKSLEGAVGAMMGLIKQEVFVSFKGKLAGLMVKPGLRKIKNRMDYNKKGGAVFLGVSKLVIKVHGSSKASAVTAAVLQAVSAVKNNTIPKLAEKLEACSFGEEA